MKLDNILRGINIISVSGNRETAIENIIFDSRNATAGSLFVAVRGTRNDGHDYITSALKAGAVAVICEKIPDNPDPQVCWIKTADPAKALGQASSNFFNNPSSSLKLVGVTGTNGKTTIATLLYKMFTGLGYKCGLFSTVCNYVIDKELPATHTTPDPVRLNSLMQEMVKAGCDYAFMEVSSHSADQQRIAGLVFAGGIFTNLTHDHLDYHKTFDRLPGSKEELFRFTSGKCFCTREC